MYKSRYIKESNPNGKNKDLIVILVIVLCISLILAGFIIVSFLKTTKKIGIVYGEEHEYIKIDDNVYKVDHDINLTTSDRDDLLGKVVFEDDATKDPIYVWTVKGEENADYIYTLWIYEGAFYKKVSTTND